MAITTTSIIADTIPTIISSARFIEQFAAVIRPLCWNIVKPNHGGKTVNLPYWGTVIVDVLTEGVDMVTEKTMADTNVQITPREVGGKIIVTYKVIRDNQEDVLRAAGRMLGEGFVAKQEGDLADQFDDATTSLGASGTLTLGVIAAAWATLEGNALSAGGPARGAKAIVHHPYVLLDIVDIFTPTTPATNTGTGIGIAERVLNQGQDSIGKVFGMPVYSSGNITKSATPTAKGVVMKTGEGGGLVCAVSQEWQILPEDDNSLRATELNVVGEYGVGEYLAGWMIELLNDATAPD